MLDASEPDLAERGPLADVLTAACCSPRPSVTWCRIPRLTVPCRATAREFRRLAREVADHECGLAVLAQVLRNGELDLMAQASPLSTGWSGRCCCCRQLGSSWYSRSLSIVIAALEPERIRPMARPVTPSRPAESRVSAVSPFVAPTSSEAISPGVRDPLRGQIDLRPLQVPVIVIVTLPSPVPIGSAAMLNSG